MEEILIMTWSSSLCLPILPLSLIGNAAAKTLFSSVSFIGMVGFNTAVKHGAFSISHDQRDKGSLLGNLWNVFAMRRAATFTAIRNVAEQSASFEEAKQALTSV